MQSYSPSWCSHVIGEYPEREVDPETGVAEPQLVRMRCTKCNDTHQVMCSTGAVRQWVLRYATAHAHRDPLGPIPKRQG